MTVGELIEILKSQDPSLPVFRYMDGAMYKAVVTTPCYYMAPQEARGYARKHNDPLSIFALTIE